MAPVIDQLAKYKNLYFIISALLTVTAFREYSLLFYPFIAAGFYWSSSSKPSKSLLIIYVAYFLVIASHFFLLDDFYWANALFFSAYFFTITSIIGASKSENPKEWLSLFINISAIILFFNNLLGFYQYYIDPWDDAFIGFYGRHGVAMHGLAIINVTLSAWFWYQSYVNLKWFKPLLALYFLVSFIFCFYGVGLIAVVLSLGLVIFLTSKFKNLALISIPCILLLLSVKFIAPNTFDYNVKNIGNTFRAFSDTSELGNVTISRKVLAFRNYGRMVKEEPSILLTGTGAGTWNSRSSFLLNGDYAPNNGVEKLVGVHRHPMAERYIFPLWNSIIVIPLDMDGTRNQPFSSLLTLFAEFGIVFALLILALVVSAYIRLVKNIKRGTTHKPLAIWVLWLFTFIAINMAVDYLFELSEMVWFAIVFTLGLLSVNQKNNAHTYSS